MKRQVTVASLVLSAIISEDNAGVVVAQTWNATTDHTTPASMTSKLLQHPAPHRGANKGGPTLGGSVLNGKHRGARDSAQGCTTTSSYQQFKSWFEPPQDQTTASQENLQQARESWYQPLPQDQKDKLTTILDQLPQDEKSRIEGELGIQ